MKNFFEEAVETVEKLKQMDAILDELINNSFKRRSEYLRATAKGEKYVFLLKNYRGENESGVKRIAQKCEELQTKMLYAFGGHHVPDSCGLGNFFAFTAVFIAGFVIIVWLINLIQNST